MEDARHLEQVRRCLRCQKGFKSASAANRICPHCSRLNQNEHVPKVIHVSFGLPAEAYDES